LFSLRRKHEVSNEELSALIDGQLAPDVSARVERHAAACAACAEKLSDLRSLRSTLADLPRAAAPRSFAVREADVRAAAAVTSDRWGRTQAVMSAATAAVFIAFGVLVAVDASPSMPSLSSSDEDGAGDSSGPLSEAPAAEGSGAESEGGAFVPGGATPHSVEDSLGAGQATSVPKEAADGDTASRPTDEATSGGELSYDQNDSPRVPGNIAVTPTPPLPATEPPEDAADAGGDDGPEGLRIAQAALAATGLVCLGGLAFVWWRRRSI
jgi:hypothetical protein